MRKFSARWWVADPLERYKAACADCEDRNGFSVRFIHAANAWDVAMYGAYVPGRVFAWK